MKRNCGENNHLHNDSIHPKMKRVMKPKMKGLKSLSSLSSSSSSKTSSKTSKPSSVLVLVRHILSFTNLPIELAKLIENYIPLYVYRLDLETNSLITNNLIILDLKEDSQNLKWKSTSTTPPTSASTRYGASVNMINDRYIFVVGGYHHSAHHGRVECFDILTCNWSVKASMKLYRYCHASIAVTEDIKFGGDKLFVFGGYIFGGEITNCCEVYNPIMDTWSSITPMRQARCLLAGVVSLNNRIYVLGGCGKDKNYNLLSSCEYYDIAENKWSLPGEISNMMFPRHSSAAIVFKNKENEHYIAIMGGMESYPPTDSHKNTDTVLLYNVKLNTWTFANWKLPCVMGGSLNVCYAELVPLTEHLVISTDSKDCWLRSLGNIVSVNNTKSHEIDEIDDDWIRLTCDPNSSELLC